MRYRPSSSTDLSSQVQVLNNSRFIDKFSIRPKEKVWLKIESVQTCIKSKYGLGKPKLFEFEAPINELSPNDEINYDFGSYLSDD